MVRRSADRRCAEHWYGQGGGGSSPSVWNRTACTTREEAAAAGINKLIATFEGIRDCKGHAPQNQSALPQRMIETLKARLSQSRQLCLFAHHRKPARCPQQRGGSSQITAERSALFLSVAGC